MGIQSVVVVSASGGAAGSAAAVLAPAEAVAPAADHSPLGWRAGSTC